MTNFWKDLSKKKKPFLALAPLDGVSDFVFREIIADIAKPDVMFTEFVSSNALQSQGYDRVIAKLKYSKKQKPIVAQIWGTKPENYYKTAKLVESLGFDGVDINMGCPVREVMKIGAGSAHIKNFELAGEIITALKKGAGKIAVSVKTRIGIDKVVTNEWIRFLLEQKLDALTVHARTAAEMSKVPAQWDEIGKAVKMRDEMKLATVIIGNGDIKNCEQANLVAKKYEVDGVMIGRGIFTNPWVFEKQAKNHDKNEFLKLLLKHARLYDKTYPEKDRFLAMRKYFKIYVRSFPGAAHLLQQLMQAESLEDVETQVGQYL